MSIDVMSQVWKHSMLKDGRELLTLLALADWADDNGGCYPSYDTIAKKVRVKKRTHAIKIVKDLIAAGELFKVGKDANHDSNLFVVLVGADNAAAIKQRITKAAGARGIKVVDNLDERIKEVMALREAFASPPQRTSPLQGTTDSPLQGTPPVPCKGPNTSVNHQIESSNKTTTPANGSRVPSPHQEIIDVYVKELAYTPQNMGREVKAAAWLVKQTYTPEQIIACYRHIKRDKFWRDKFVSLQKVAEQIAEVAGRNGTAAAPAYRKPTQAEIDAAMSAPILE
jgi:hypothetical protein